MNLKRIQAALKNTGADGWLLCDFHNRDPIAARVLGLDARAYNTRRWFYYIPAHGRPQKLVHAIESRVLSGCPGTSITYRGHEELHAGLRTMLAGVGRVAMQYSPFGNIPTVSLVDAGTAELVVSTGVELVSSASLVAALHSTISARGFQLHREAGEQIQAIKDEAFELIFRSVRRGKALSEWALQQHILRRFSEENLTPGSHGAIVAINEHGADPHFEPAKNGSAIFKRGDRILLDIWGKVNDPEGVYYDITWCGFAGDDPPARYRDLFALIVRARDAALNFVRESHAAARTIHGYEVDRVCRAVIAAGGYEKYFTHRTGHSIDTEVHGDGANIDNIETLDDREILASTCFSIEPGIYKGNIGVRTEISVCIGAQKQVQVHGQIQSELVTMG